MKFLLTKRGGGKTRQLIKLAAANPDSVIICTDQGRFRGIEDAAISLGLPCPNLFTVNQWQRSGPSGGRVNIMIDDVDDVLSSILRGRDIDLVTSTIEDKADVSIYAPGAVAPRNYPSYKYEEMALLQEAMAATGADVSGEEGDLPETVMKRAGGVEAYIRVLIKEIKELRNQAATDDLSRLLDLRRPK